MSAFATYEVVQIEGGAGVTTGQSSQLRGVLEAIGYIPSQTATYAGTATLTVTIKRAKGTIDEIVMEDVALTGTDNIWFRPRLAVHDIDGAEIAGHETQAYLAMDHLEISVNLAGVGNFGDFYLLFARP